MWPSYKRNGKSSLTKFSMKKSNSMFTRMNNLQIKLLQHIVILSSLSFRRKISKREKKKWIFPENNNVCNGNCTLLQYTALFAYKIIIACFFNVHHRGKEGSLTYFKKSDSGAINWILYPPHSLISGVRKIQK